MNKQTQTVVEWTRANHDDNTRETWEAMRMGCCLDLQKSVSNDMRMCLEGRFPESEVLLEAIIEDWLSMVDWGVVLQVIEEMFGKLPNRD